MRYSNSIAATVGDDDNAGQMTDPSVIVDVGDVDGDELRWWCAILAPEQGWHATLTSTYLSPWSVCYQGFSEFKLKTSATHSSHEVSKPASCDQAFQYLCHFSARHSLENQSLAALAAVLTLPIFNSLRREVRLPLSHLISAPQSSSTQYRILQERHNLPYYMTLSSSVNVLGSVIWGSFWEPGVDCNVVSAWFQPILSVLTPLILHQDHDMLIKVLALHRPTLAPLWLGAAMTGLSNFIPLFLKSLDAPYARPDSIAAAWTGSPQSFLDQTGRGPYIYSDDAIASSPLGEANLPSNDAATLVIKRADRWRLLHDIGEPPYNSTSLVPWPPFGRISLVACELGVRQHERCKRHLKRYKHWNWITADGLSLDDFGFVDRVSDIQPGPDSAPSPLESDPSWQDYIDETASMTATRNIFAWNSVNGEGYWPGEKAIFEHEWLDGLLDEDSDYESATYSIKSR